MARPKIPLPVVERDGPFREFKQDASIVSVELADGSTVGRVLLVYPNEVWAVDGANAMPFDPVQVVRAFQTADDLATRSSSEWKFFGGTDAI
jgi:hypothetical protein